MHLLWFLRLLRLSVPQSHAKPTVFTTSLRLSKWTDSRKAFISRSLAAVRLVCSVTELRAFPNATPWQRDRRSSKASRAGLLEFTETSYWIFPFRDEILLKRRTMLGQTVEVTKGESNVSLRRQRQVSLWLGDWRRMEGGENDDFVNLHCHILRSLNFCELLWDLCVSSKRTQNVKQ